MMGLVSRLCRRVAMAVIRQNRRPDGSGADVGLLLARRAERVSNRKRAAADQYIATHKALMVRR